MKRLAVALIIATGSVPLAAEPCFACSCAPREEGQSRQEYREEQAKNADVIFTGRVRRIEGSEDPGGSIEAYFRVGKAYKGTHRKRLIIETNSSGAACGYSFKDGKRYTVFGFGEGPKRYSTGICTGTQRGRIDPEKYGLD